MTESQVAAWQVRGAGESLDEELLDGSSLDERGACRAPRAPNHAGVARVSFGEATRFQA